MCGGRAKPCTILKWPGRSYTAMDVPCRTHSWEQRATDDSHGVQYRPADRGPYPYCRHGHCAYVAAYDAAAAGEIHAKQAEGSAGCVASLIEHGASRSAIRKVAAHAKREAYLAHQAARRAAHAKSITRTYAGMSQGDHTVRALHRLARAAARDAAYSALAARRSARSAMDAVRSSRGGSRHGAPAGA